MAKKPCRDIPVEPDRRPTVLVASDAQVEPGTLPGGGVLLEDPHTQEKWGGWLQFEETELSLWGTSMRGIEGGDQPIALCEAAMVPLALLQWPEKVRNRKLVWYVDNTSAMASMVKGASANQHLERIVGLTWMIAYHLQADIWFEWVDSESNWSDSISRHFEKDEVSKKLGFSTHPMTKDTSWWGKDWCEIWDRLERQFQRATRTVEEQALEQ